ncbi:MAG TPA: cytochrome c oxidase accessory protein CcoG [Polyangiaceae bacterium]|nr:cytochrome c oxidase accessory protein CcoG [Polyangiaceae bacterium]
MSANVRLPLAEQPELTSAALPGSGRRHEIHPADVKGRFHVARLVVFALLIGLWIALPIVKIGGHPAVFLDVDDRRFFLFGATFNSQDTWLLFFLLTGVGFGLVYATALAGRVWCGWACPQTVFLEGVFRRIERWIEGPREKRVRRNAGPWTVDKLVRKSATQVLYVVASIGVAHVFLSYFVSIPKAFEMVRESPSMHPEAFAWVAALSAAFYLNFAWFREQLCVVLCPYGRLQSALLDEHSLVVGYDVRRGEPRGKKGTAGAGDCVDCKRCVVVCPTGIDIRNGVQMECLACTQCIDACDEIMGRLGRPRGLIRYDSQDGLAGKPRRIVRPRVILYSVLLVVGAVVALLATRRRTDFEATLLRLPGEPYTLDDGQVRNSLQLHLVNKRADLERYRIQVEHADGMTVVLPMQEVALQSMASTRVPLFLTVSRASFHAEFPVRVHVVREADARDEVAASATFLGPTR